MRFALLVFIWISFSAYAQIEGTYTRDGEVYTFHHDSVFSWIKTGAEVSYGSGTYQLNGKLLELNFEKELLQYEFQVNESKLNNGDKSVVEVRIMYSNGQPVPQAKFTLTQSGITQYLNAQGILKLELSNALLIDNFVIAVNGRSSGPIRIKLRGYDTLLGLVVDETDKYKDDRRETHSFKKKRGRIKLDKKTFREIMR
jgi:hypothetical protein